MSIGLVVVLMSLTAAIIFSVQAVYHCAAEGSKDTAVWWVCYAIFLTFVATGILIHLPKVN